MAGDGDTLLDRILTNAAEHPDKVCWSGLHRQLPRVTPSRHNAQLAFRFLDDSGKESRTISYKVGAYSTACHSAWSLTRTGPRSWRSGPAIWHGTCGRVTGVPSPPRAIEMARRRRQPTH